MWILLVESRWIRQRFSKVRKYTIIMKTQNPGMHAASNQWPYNSHSMVFIFQFSTVSGSHGCFSKNTVSVKSMSPVDIKLLFGNLHNITALDHNTNIFSIEIK